MGAKKIFRYQFNGYGGKGDGFHGAEMLLVQGEDHEHALKGHGRPEVRRQMLGAWHSFAATGDPNTPELCGAWLPYSNACRPIAFWDGDDGFSPNGADSICKRKGLSATARLWEELWQVEPVLSCEERRVLNGEALTYSEAVVAFKAEGLKLGDILTRWATMTKAAGWRERHERSELLDRVKSFKDTAERERFETAQDCSYRERFESFGGLSSCGTNASSRNRFMSVEDAEAELR